MKLYYPFEIIVLQKGMEETYIDITDACRDTIAYSRSMIASAPSSTRPSVSEDDCRLLMREFDVSRRDAEDALVASDGDLYRAAVDLTCCT